MTPHVYPYLSTIHSGHLEDILIPRAFLTTKKEVKETLLNNGMIYVGTIDKDRNAHFDSERFKGAHQVIVLARGEV
jgi:hypothetical protein